MEKSLIPYAPPKYSVLRVVQIRMFRGLGGWYGCPHYVHFAGTCRGERDWEGPELLVIERKSPCYMSEGLSGSSSRYVFSGSFVSFSIRSKSLSKSRS